MGNPKPSHTSDARTDSTHRVHIQEPAPPELEVVKPEEELMYWQAPGALLGLFSQMEERNLFLVQHLQVRAYEGLGL